MSHTGALVLRRGLRIGDVGAASKGQVEEGEVCGTGKSQPKKRRKKKSKENPLLTKDIIVWRASLHNLNNTFQVLI